MNRLYYVYMYFRPWNGEPCYVGKGKKRRWLDHDRFGENHPKCHFANIFKKAKRLGIKVIRVKVREDMTHEEAKALEISLIKYIGRKEDGGPLVNLMGGGDGPEHGEETKKTIGVKSKKMWSDPVLRDKVIAAQNVGRNTAEYRAERRLISKRIFSDPIVLEKSSKTHKLYYSNSENRNKTSAATKEAMARPEVKANISAAQLERFKRPEERAKNALRNVGRKQSQEEKDGRAESLRGQKRDLKARANMSEAQRKRGQLNPPTAATRAKMSMSAKKRAASKEGRKNLSRAGKISAAKKSSLQLQLEGDN